MVELFLPVDFFVVLVALCADAPVFLSAIFVLDEVVVLVSVLLAQEARKATPMRATVEERIDFFIGLVAKRTSRYSAASDTASKITDRFPCGTLYSARSATMGLT